ncbi:hypothetical protein DSCA_58350 [Desulfosarcina alkanivorans]|uniref:PAC domain-containing protein n=1 Tax=Desulfosarcina alkanivorans TaxID=571177 RepID=A0A5K7YU23_9BACT|nr:PAS domain-containing protein [Desulfosarcina alkanivorans]BBO71905.1 hypothetical protein DSCA_58350 [Desulfosarcina alkanivorans]
MVTYDRSTEHASSEHLRRRLAELTRRHTELEKSRQGLTREREALKKKLADCSRLLGASTTGLISLDKAGLIDWVNDHAVDMLGADKAFLLKKPISLFIAPEDQAVFYLHRSRIFSGTANHPFEINLKARDGVIRSVRVNARPVDTPRQQLPGMLLAVEDITPHRQALKPFNSKNTLSTCCFPSSMILRYGPRPTSTKLSSTPWKKQAWHRLPTGSMSACFMTEKPGFPSPMSGSAKRPNPLRRL